jgi:hypothetical protein
MMQEKRTQALFVSKKLVIHEQFTYTYKTISPGILKIPEKAKSIPIFVVPM